jgi:hypothetical protein
MKKPVQAAVATKKRLSLQQVVAKYGPVIGHYVELYHAYTNASVYVVETATGKYRDRLSQAKAFRQLAKYAVLFATGRHPWAPEPDEGFCSLSMFTRAVRECSPQSCGVAAQRIFIAHNGYTLGYRTKAEAREVQERMGWPRCVRFYAQHTGSGPEWKEVKVMEQ